MQYYDYPAFTIVGDMDVDSLVLRRAAWHPALYCIGAAHDEFDLSDSQLAKVRRLMAVFLAAKLPNDMTGVIYVIDGEYHTFRAPQGGTPKVFDALTEYLWSLYKAR